MEMDKESAIKYILDNDKRNIYYYDYLNEMELVDLNYIIAHRLNKSEPTIKDIFKI